MDSSINNALHKIQLMLKKQNDQNRFAFLKNIDFTYDEKDFSMQDPFCLLQNRWIQQEQIDWIEKIGAGSLSERFQSEHFDLQMSLGTYLDPKPFFSKMSFTQVKSILLEKLGETTYYTLEPYFYEDTLGITPIKGADPNHLLIATRISPFPQFFLVKQPLKAFLENQAPFCLEKPYDLAAIRSTLMMRENLQQLLTKLESKASTFSCRLEELGFDSIADSYRVQIATPFATKFCKELQSFGWKLGVKENLLIFYFRDDHAEDTIYHLLTDLKVICSKKEPIFC